MSQQTMRGQRSNLRPIAALVDEVPVSSAMIRVPDFEPPTPIAPEFAPSVIAPEVTPSVIAPEVTPPVDEVPTGTTLPDLNDYPARELDVYPRALTPISPAYPADALQAQGDGSVTLEVLIDESGRVTQTSVVDAAPTGIFEHAAQQAVASVLFYPAQKDGRTVRSRILMKLEFSPGTPDVTQ